MLESSSDRQGQKLICFCSKFNGVGASPSQNIRRITRRGSLQSAQGMYRRGETTGNNDTNGKLAVGSFKKIRKLPREEEKILFDPQTSGGLLLCLPSAKTDHLIPELIKARIEAAVPVNEVVASTKPWVWVI